MPKVTLELHDGTARRVEIDLDRLTPRARAIAEVVATRDLRTRCPLILESVKTIREMDPGADPTYYGSVMDEPHRTVWDHWARYQTTSTTDPHDYLEAEARKLPLGYYPVGCSKDHRVPTAEAAREDAALLDKTQVLELLRELGRPISSGVVDNYRSRPPAGWPQPARYVGRTPQWNRAEIEAWALASQE